MKLISIIGLAGAVSITLIEGAFAAPCSNGSRITDTTLADYLQGDLTCAYKPDNTNGADANARWSSLQTGTGLSSASPLYEVARGAGDPVDPTKEVGTWALVNDSNAIVSNASDATRVQYNYGSNTYTWEVWTLSGGPEPYQFCDPNNADERIAYAKDAVTGVTPGSATGNECAW
jgi:hypothetical protein